MANKRKKAAQVAKAYQQSMGGDSLNPTSAPAPGDPMTKLFANPTAEESF